MGVNARLKATDTETVAIKDAGEGSRRVSYGGQRKNENRGTNR